MKSIKYSILFAAIVFSIWGCIDRTPYIGDKICGVWSLGCACEDYSIPGPDDVVFQYDIYISPSGGYNEVAITNVHESDTSHIYLADIHTQYSFSGFAFEGEIQNEILYVHYIYQNFECQATGIKQ